MAVLAAVRRLQVAADSAVIVAKLTTPLLTVQHQALAHGLRLLDTPRIQQPSRDLASPPVDAASLVAGWENDDHQLPRFLGMQTTTLCRVADSAGGVA